MINIFDTLKTFFPYLKDFFELVGVAILSIGSFYAICVYIRDLIKHRYNSENIFYKFKINLGKAIAAGLELTIVADLINTTIDVNYYKLGQLFILVAIRTFIGYFLNKDIEIKSIN